MTPRNDVEAARQAAKVREIKRREQLAGWNDFISFFTAKVLGLGGLTVGGLNILAPHLLPITVSQPAWVAAAGLALFTGKSLLRLVSSADDALGRRK